MRIAAVAVVTGSLLGARQAAAQAPDSSSSLLAWDNLTFYLHADTATGLLLWVGAEFARHGRPDARSFLARYDPALVQGWVEEASLLLLPERVAPGDPPDELISAPLTDIQGGRFVVARERDGSRWSERAVLSFRPRDNPPLTFRVRRNQITQLLASLERHSRQSRLTHSSAALSLDACGDSLPADSTRLPEHISSPQPTYPPALKNKGVSGMVLISVTVDSAGIPISDQTTVVSGTHPSFAQTAKDLVLGSRYRMPKLDGRAAVVRFCVPVTFMVSYSP